jgi:hypothetical protein
VVGTAKAWNMSVEDQVLLVVVLVSLPTLLLAADCWGM